MDIFSHGLYGGVLTGRKSRKSFWTAFIFGISPDLFSFGIFTLSILLGFVSYFKLQDYLAAADAVIDPKRGTSESSGKLYAYIEARKPIICFDTKFNRSILGNYALYMNSFMDIPGLVIKRNINRLLPYESLEKLLWSNNIRVIANKIDKDLYRL